MAKTQTDPMTPTITIILLALTAALAYWLGFSGQKFVSFDSRSTSTESRETITTKSDLDQASDELDATNLDAVDQGLNTLQSEISNY